MAAASLYSYDANTTTPQELARRRRLTELMLNGRKTPQNWGEGVGAILSGLARGAENRQLDQQEAAGQASAANLSNEFGSYMQNRNTFPDAPFTTGDGGAGSTVSGVDAPDMSGNQIYSEFMDGIKGAGVSNPNALAAIAATGKAESGFSPGNVYRTWSDPSEGGAAGTAGGIMSWRGPRLAAMQKFAAANGGDPRRPSPALQAQFLAQEDPNLIAALNSAKTPAEAQQLMNNAWKFAGYNRPGGEAARRLGLANSFASQFAGGGLTNDLVQRPGMTAQASDLVQRPDSADNLAVKPLVQTASLDPSIGMAQASPVQMQPGPIPNAGPQQSAFIDRMTSPQSMTGGAPMPMQGGPQQVAQAAPAPSGPDLSRLSVMAGGNAGVRRQDDAPPMDYGMLMKVMNNPWLDDGTKAFARAMLKQQMDAQDPGNQLDMEYKRAQLDALRNPKSTPTDDMREYQFAKSQGYNGNFQQYMLDMKRAGSGSTVINNGTNSNKFVEESDKAAAGRMNDIVTAGQTAPQTMADMQQLLDLGAQIGTGKGAQVMAALGPYAQAMGVDIKGLGEAQAYEAITSRLAPQMRASGSGSSSDRDVSMFLQSLPNLRNLPEGNTIIANTMKSVAQNKINAADIASKAQRGDITWQEADKQIRALPNPYELFKDFQKGSAAGNKTSSGVKWKVK